jgi:hypothetical protein
MVAWRPGGTWNQDQAARKHSCLDHRPQEKSCRVSAQSVQCAVYQCAGSAKYGRPTLGSGSLGRPQAPAPLGRSGAPRAFQLCTCNLRSHHTARLRGPDWPDRSCWQSASQLPARATVTARCCPGAMSARGSQVCTESSTDYDAANAEDIRAIDQARLHGAGHTASKPPRVEIC